MNPSSLPWQAVLFDMDGLMLDTESVVRDAMRSAMQELGYRLEDALFGAMIGRTGDSVAQLLHTEFGADFPLDALRRLSAQKFQELVDDNGIAKKPGLDELLDYVDQQGLSKAVGTSTRRQEAHHRLQLSGLFERFPVIVCGDEVAHGKPDPDIYLAAAKRLAVVPQQCFVLEDSEAGVRAARAAGMTPFMVPDLVSPSDSARSLAQDVFSSLHAVREFLQEYYR